MSNDDIEAARDYHEITKHSYTSVRSTPICLTGTIGRCLSRFTRRRLKSPYHAN